MASQTSTTTSSRKWDPFETRANDAASTITRGTWDYAKQFYHPLEQELIDKSRYINETEAFWRGHEAQARANSTYDAHLRDLRRQGATLSGQQMQALNRQRGLAVATQRAAATNQDRLAQYDFNKNMIAALTGFGRSSLANAMQASNAAAGMESSRNTSGGYTDTSTTTTKSKSSSSSGLLNTVVGAAVSGLVGAFI
jgi:hypothetical protein